MVEVINESMSKKTPVKAGLKSYIIANNKFNNDALKKWVKLGSGREKEQTAALAIPLQTTDKKKPLINIGQFDKPKVNVNRGDMAEGVAAAAIATRFLHKDEPIKASDVFSLLTKLSKKPIKNYAGKQGKYINAEYDSPNKNPKIKDLVKIYISLSDVNMTALLDPASRPILEELVDSSVAYVNSVIVSKWAKLLYENNRFDTIEVTSDGLGGQTTTKVDVRVKVTDDKGKLVPVNINISLKAGDVKQFGQVSGAEFEKQIQLWDTLFGYGSKIESMRKTYETTMFKKKDPGTAIGKVYEQISKLLNRDFKSSPTKILKKMSEGLNYYATSGEKDVTLVQFEGGTASVYKFDDIYAKIGKLKFTASVEYGASELPTLMISSGGSSLFKVRTKQEFKPDGSPYVRNYVEKEALFTKLLSTKYK